MSPADESLLAAVRALVAGFDAATRPDGPTGQALIDLALGVVDAGRRDVDIDRPRLVLHIEVPGVDVSDLTADNLAMVDGDLDHPEDVMDYLVTDQLDHEVIVVLNTHDSVATRTLSPQPGRIVGAQVTGSVDR